LRDPNLYRTPLIQAANEVKTCLRRTTLGLECIAPAHDSLGSIILVAGFDLYDPLEESLFSPKTHYPED